MPLNSGSPEMDGLHVVAIRIPNEAAVVPGAVPPLLRLMQHLGTSGACHLDERVDLRARPRPEGKVDVVVRAAGRVDGADPEVGTGARTAEADMIAVDEKCLSAERLQHSFVERPARNGVRTLNRDVSKHAPKVQRRIKGSAAYRWLGPWPSCTMGE